MAVNFTQEMLTNPSPDLSEEQKRDYNRWVALLSYLNRYSADSAWLKDLLSTHFAAAPIFSPDYE